MRSSIKFGISMLLGLVIVSAAGAQERKVAKTDIEKLTAEAETKLKNLSYREKTINLGYMDHTKPPYFNSTVVYEYLRPDRKRRSYEETTNKGTMRTESIEIGNKEYSRKGGGAWTVTAKQSPNLSGSIMLGSVGESKDSVIYEYVSLGEETINGILADVYQATTTRILHSARGDIRNPSVKKYWFDKKGRFVKKTTQTTDSVSRALHKDTTEYEYDINLTIEVPIK